MYNENLLYMARATEKKDVNKRCWKKRVRETFTICFGRPAIPEDSRDLLVHLAIFSGMPDPKWIVTPDSELYGAIITKLQYVPPGHRLPSILGYKGFYVSMSLHGRKVTWEVPCNGDKVLQNLLLDTSPTDIDDMKEEVRKYINEGDTDNS